MPVLLFVLAGTMLLIISGLVCAGKLEAVRSTEHIEATAARFAESLEDYLVGPAYESATPTLAYLSNTSISESLRTSIGQAHFSVSIFLIFPEYRLLCSLTDSDQARVMETGAAGFLINALDSFGRAVVVEVRVLVWQDQA